MSDIHGCLEQLKEKMNLVDLDGNNKLLFLGDYIDYGSESGPVLRFVYDLQKQYGKDKVIVLKGNHEAMLLEWIDEYNKPVTKAMEELSYDSWLETDEKQHFNTFRTLVTEAQFLEFSDFSKTASYAKKNAEAVRMILETSGELIKWMRSMELFYKTETQIFVHAGVDEEAEEYWEWGSGEEIFLWKFPASRGKFVKTVIAGHVGTDSLARDKMTMLVVTHEMSFARDVGTHVVYMADGVIEEEGTPEKIFDSPEREKTRRFVTLHNC